jgi:hypothetical protein
MLYRNRRYLPRIESPESTYFVTFRLAGTLPATALYQISTESDSISNVAKQLNRKLTVQEEMRLKYLRSVRIQEYLDKGIGECWLNNPQISQMVTQSIAFFEGTKYVTYVFCIMPNHIHWLLKPNCEILPENESALVSVMHSIKSFTAHRANRILNRTGHFWSKEYYDHRVGAQRN